MDSDINSNKNDDLLSFYSELLRHGAGILASGFTDFIIYEGEGDIVEYCVHRGLPATQDNYDKGVSHFKSTILFDKIYKEIASIKPINERQEYWKNLKPEIEFYVTKLADKLKAYPFFSTDLNQVIADVELRFKAVTNTSSSQETSSTNKIKWLYTTKALATLFYDLWKGQERPNNWLKNLVCVRFKFVLPNRSFQQCRLNIISAVNQKL